MPSSPAFPAAAMCGQSRFGWFAVAGTGQAVMRVIIGHETESDLIVQLTTSENFVRDEESAPSLLRHAFDEIERYFDGEPVDLTAIPVATGPRTAFQKRVVQSLRQIGYGQTVSYAELAQRAGAPRAARAVGTVMSSNPLPLLIPCHRVVGAGGRLGGFSAPPGIELKRALLAMEAGEQPAVDQNRMHSTSVMLQGASS
ncbi:MAG: methylated-DNA--[protein]-cysteine S-methyltransferase [Planctomycetaceae bacterium]|nr:methylated-DNA--[protein]-cysteine S-methyltransferase [Planctomycetaceae bacterium]